MSCITGKNSLRMGSSSVGAAFKAIHCLRGCRGGGIAQWLASLSIKLAVQVRALLDLLVAERWNSISATDLFPPVLTTGSTNASMCYPVYVIIQVKDP